MYIYIYISQAPLFMGLLFQRGQRGGQNSMYFGPDNCDISTLYSPLGYLVIFRNKLTICDYEIVIFRGSNEPMSDNQFGEGLDSLSRYPPSSFM